MGWRTLPRQGARAFLDRMGVGGGVDEQRDTPCIAMLARALSLNLTVGMRLVGTQARGCPLFYDAQVGVNSYYHKLQPASN